MKKCILLLLNKQEYPNTTDCLRKLEDMLLDMGYNVQCLDESDESYDDELVAFIQKTCKSIECKAVLSCNAIGIDVIAAQLECLYLTYLDKYWLDQGVLENGNNNTIVFCADREQNEVLAHKYKNIKEIRYANLEYAENEENLMLQRAQFVVDMHELIGVKQGKASVLKILIENAFRENNLTQAKIWIEQYRQLRPYDMDLLAMEVNYALGVGDVETALRYAKVGVRRYPCSGDMHYNLANVYEYMQKWYYAWLEYYRARGIYRYDEDVKEILLSIHDKIAYCEQRYAEVGDDEEHASIEESLESEAWFVEKAYRSMKKQVVGKYFWENENKKRYLAIYKDLMLRYYEDQYDLVHVKGEFLEVKEGQAYSVPIEYKEYLLPIASEQRGNKHAFCIEDKKYVVNQINDKHFTYYRLSGGTNVVSQGKSYYGKAIPLKHDKEKKKLVLNIFMDGLSQCMLENEHLAKNMPHTARFFDKGVICTKAYTASEWTYPSIASYVTGVETNRHMLFHNLLDSRIPDEYPTLAEYFQKEGYYTTYMGGDWRIVPSYGHARGYDSFIYQHQEVGFKAEQIIGEALEHLEAFKETNQFLWISIGDLHNVADGFDMPQFVQNNLSIEDLIEEEMGKTSVKQNYNESKIKKYIKMVHKMDFLLNLLFTYLEENYKDDEIIVSLFADHGQGYMVPTGGHMCEKERANVAFMFRAGKKYKGECEELISTTDYSSIMCKLAGIKMQDVKIDGVLPKYFGGKGREYSLMQSIHPGDPYYAAIYMEDKVFFFENPYPIQNDGRFYLKKWTAELFNVNGEKIYDMDVYNECLKIIEEHINDLLIYD